MDEYEDEQEVREGVWNQFRWSIQALAMDADVQRSLFPDFTCKADELALDFDHWFKVAQGHFAKQFSNEQLVAIRAIDQKLTTMSNGGSGFDEALWWDDSLATRSEWQEVRSLAMHALQQFGWQLEKPPWGRSQYARYEPNPE